MFRSRVLVSAVVLTLVVTFYSLSELHRISAQHAETDGSNFVTHVESKGSGSGVSEPRKLAGGGSPVVGHVQAQPMAVKKEPVQQGTAVTKAGSSSHVCYTYPNTELWGEVVAWGTTNKADSVEQCCEMCKNFKTTRDDELGCNVYVYCGDPEKCKAEYKQCWLKHLPHPEASKPAKQGPNVQWTSGTLDVDINADPSHGRKKESGPARKFHIVTSAQGSATHWQVRIHYYWYLVRKAECEKADPTGCEMGGFTRLLHSGSPDDLMKEIPTMVVDPLPQSMVEHSWYVVLNRPYAFVEWVEKAKIPERYVLMAEPDHIFVRPMPNFMIGDKPAAFPFFYIEPTKPEHQAITMKFTGKVTRKQLEEIAPIGNSPTFMTFEDMKKIMPIWMNTSIAIFKDEESNKAWGWVQEMYGFTIACWLGGIKKIDLYMNLMAQPPWDTNMDMAPGKPFYIIHYTYGMDYKLNGEFTPGKFGEWRFDKRTYSSRPLPRHLGEPPKNMKNDLVRKLISSFNEATDAIPCWDKYAETGKVPETCDEAPKGFLAELAKKASAT